jgi:hypothetical protein
MANLYEINQAILDCLDPETGEIIDDRISDLLMEKEQKLENIALWIKNLQADVQMFKAEKESFEKRQKAAERKLTSLMQYLTDNLQGEKFSTGKCFVSFRKSDRVEVYNDALVPKKYLTKKVTFAPDKDAIKALLKSGHKINGCRLVEKLNPQIK